LLVSWSAILGTLAAAADQDALARAKDLYLSAAYDEALAALRDYHSPPDEMVEADEYRAFCLFALGKVDDAARVIEQIVAARPSFQPAAAQASPRIQEMFRSVRRRVLPAIARQAYTEAKDAFARSDFDVAAKQFERVTALLADADVADSGDLSDLRLLAKGFGELIEKQTAEAARPAAARPAAARPASVQASPREASEVDRIYGADDSDVTPPVAISQTLPPWHPTGPQGETYECALLVVIDETGRVVSVRVTGTLSAPYEILLRQAAGRWKYRPALRNGRPVKFQRAIAIRLQPQQ
jgi:tetratricopeptide (TPR) repeat protein